MISQFIKWGGICRPIAGGDEGFRSGHKTPCRNLAAPGIPRR